MVDTEICVPAARSAHERTMVTITNPAHIEPENGLIEQLLLVVTNRMFEGFSDDRYDTEHERHAVDEFVRRAAARSEAA